MNVVSQDGFSDRLRRALSDDGYGEPAIAALAEYLHGYDGRHFETYGQQDSSPDRITPADLVAVTMLSMEIRRGTTSGFTPEQAVAIADDDEHITGLLQQIPADR